MINRRFTLLTFAALVVGAFLSPASASAQSIWERMRDRAREAERQQQRLRPPTDRDYRRDRRRDDAYGRGRSGRSAFRRGDACATSRGASTAAAATCSAT